MRKVLEKYLDKEIGINCVKAFYIESAKLVDLNDEYFSIIDHRNGYTHHYSYRSVVQIIEHPSGIEVGGMFTHKVNYSVVVKVGHLLEYVPA
jgi:hypothetical protein